MTLESEESTIPCVLSIHYQSCLILRNEMNPSTVRINPQIAHKTYIYKIIYKKIILVGKLMIGDLANMADFSSISWAFNPSRTLAWLAYLRH